MKYVSILLFVMLIIMFGSTGNAQVTNLQVNGTSSNFTMASGGTITWSYDVPNGATATGHIWYDVNQNGVIDPLVDATRFIFTQTDGDTNDNGGPPDIDGTVNGQVLFSTQVGLAPGKYIMEFTQNSVSASIVGTVTPLVSPSHLISGTVTPPEGKSPKNIFVTLDVRSDSGGGNNTFWDGITDSAGNYTIQMDADTAGNPWRIRLESNPYPPDIVTPEEIQITITGNHGGNDFSFLQAASQVTGYFFDENDSPQIDRDVQLSASDNTVYRQARTNVEGFFQIGILASELGEKSWRLQGQSRGNGSSTELTAQVSISAINSGDSLSRNLVVYYVNSKIQGHVKIDGVGPAFPIHIVASNEDTAQTEIWADPTTGDFSIGVSDKISNYYVFAIELPFGWQGNSILAHPGDADVVFNIITTDVKEREPGVPDKFSLGQNFPNPFNPSTTINYDLPVLSDVTLTIFNLIGQEVSQIVNTRQQAGKYTASFDAGKLANGVYFYTLRAGSFVSTKKMIFIK